MGYLVYLLFTCLAFYTIQIGGAHTSPSLCPTSACPSCWYGSHGYRYDWRGCQECYCMWDTTVGYVTSGCPYAMCPTCDYNHYPTYRYDWRGCQECYCEVRYTTPPPYQATTDSSLQPRPANYWSMSRSSMLSIILNLKHQAQSLLDNAKDTYDHILHSVIVNDLKKRREAHIQEEGKNEVEIKKV